MGRLCIWLDGWRWVEDRLQADATVCGARGGSGDFSHDCTAGWQVWASECSWSGVLRLVWRWVWELLFLCNCRVLRSKFDSGWMLWRVWGQTSDVLKGRELKLGLDCERKGEKCRGWKVGVVWLWMGGREQVAVSRWICLSWAAAAGQAVQMCVKWKKDISLFLNQQGGVRFEFTI